MILSTIREKFLRVHKHLLPRAIAWDITVDKTLRQFFEGLTGLPADVKAYYDQLFLDIFPETTTQLEEWETQFGILPSTTDEADRRENLAAAWRAVGGQGPGYLEDTLQDAGFNVFVHEPWYIGLGFNDAINCGDPEAEAGESDALCGISEQDRKFLRDPREYINDSSTPVFYVVECDEPLAQCDEPTALCGDTSNPRGILLVNKITFVEPIYVTAVLCDGVDAECGEPEAICGNNTGFTFGQQPYFISDNPDDWAHFWYIGGEIFPDFANVDAARRGEFETLVLKIKPAHTWVGLLVNYGTA